MPHYPYRPAHRPPIKHVPVAEEFRQRVAALEWPAAHQVLMLHLAPAWACRGPRGWAALQAAAGKLHGHDKEIDGRCGPGTFAKGAGLLNTHAAAQVSEQSRYTTG